MDERIPGLHHVTAVAADLNRNVDFYTRILGLRLVKRTVNFDDPGSYHLYYGNGEGSPGTLITFFHWPDARRSRPGSGTVSSVAFSVPEGSLAYWRRRLEGHDVAAMDAEGRYDGEAVAFTDPDGLSLALVSSPSPDSRNPWEEGPVPAGHAVRGLHALTLATAGRKSTVSFLSTLLGFRLVREEGSRLRFAAGAGGPGAIACVYVLPDGYPGRGGFGAVHHVAWRIPSAAGQESWRRAIEQAGRSVTPVIDRLYFRSIYFREPGGILFEIATDGPGFAVDEPLETLGESLVLPPWLEGRRGAIEKSLPPIEPPEAA
ncbi:MAG TPA: ring-cleaving dioxygenase [Candidatus Aquicultoraceae bacterium]|nr:ring-cleaving dioxygenase [Candidatus Aquicultoraceae bacterium]